MKLYQAAAALFASAVVVSAFTAPSKVPISRSMGTRTFVPKFGTSLAMSDSAVVDAETVEEGETFE
eukprot:scaffold26622_cov147-Skeletonema_menzelii.AAC.26